MQIYPIPEVFTNTRTQSVPKLKIPTRWALLTVETVGTVETVEAVDSLEHSKLSPDGMGWDWMVILYTVTPRASLQSNANKSFLKTNTI